MQRLMTGLRDESGVALITALLATMIMLALGLALLSIVDTQANDSNSERTRDRGFNLSESVLSSEAFVLGRNWPTFGTMDCTGASSGFGTSVGASSGSTDVNRLRTNINESYTDIAYAGATWRVDICDDNDLSKVWSASLLSATNYNYDQNDNSKVWVRAQSTVDGKSRVLVGLVTVLNTYPLNSKYGLVAGNISEDLSSTTSAITNATVVSNLTSGLLNTNPPVAADGSYPVPASGVTGVRCGLLENISQVKTCVTGAIGALSSVPAVNALVTQGKYEQYPTTTSTSAANIAQLRSQAKTAGVYMASVSGAASVNGAPSCGITGATSSSVVFIEKVGSGDQYCYVDVSTSVTYKALVIGSGRVIIRGNNSITPYSTTTSNRFTGVVYALNLQSTDLTSSSPTFEIVRIDKGARVTGAVHADGKNATVGLVTPDFSTDALVDALLCPGVSCAHAGTVKLLAGTLGVSGLVDALVNGTCLETAPILGCTVSLPGQGATAVASGIAAQLSNYGSAIHSDVAKINKLMVYGSSGVTPGTFRDLHVK
ncbi:MAG: hypothetical protein WKF96_19895 [Solirubrobacteraceae bacterium]